MTDENEVLVWGKFNDKHEVQERYLLEPTCIFKAEEGFLNIESDENQVIDKVFGIKDTGFVFTSK